MMSNVSNTILQYIHVTLIFKKMFQCQKWCLVTRFHITWAWINNYIHSILWDIITHVGHKFESWFPNNVGKYQWQLACKELMSFVSVYLQVRFEWRKCDFSGKTVINSFGAETGIFWDDYINTMAADDLAPCVARSWAVMILTMLD